MLSSAVVKSLRECIVVIPAANALRSPIMKALLLACAIAATAFASAPTITNCSPANALLKNLQYSLSPDSITPGQNITISVSGDLTASINDAQIALTASFMGIPIVNKKVDICQLEKNVCPIKAGPFSYKIDHQIPNIPISGTVDAKATITSQPSNDVVVCIDVKADI